MANPPNSQKFSIHVVGDRTEKLFKADFIVTEIMSHRQRFIQDQLFREYVGGQNPQFASDDIRKRAEILADINSALMAPVPQFWTQAGMGIDLLDDNVVVEVWNAVVKVQVDQAEKTKAKTEAAAKRLQDAVAKGPDAEDKPEE